MGQQATFISVVISTRNRCELLEKTIESLFIQSYPTDRYEIIIVDNDSSDSTEEMVNRAIVKAPCRLRYYRKDNEGPGASRNMGAELAYGDIIAFTDSDCVAHRDWLKMGAAKMANGVGVVQGKTVPNPEQQRATLIHTQEVLKENGFYETCNVFYLKEAFDAVGGFSADFYGKLFWGYTVWGGEDTDLAWRVKKKGWKSIFVDEAVIYHHIFYLTPLQQ